MSDNMPFWVGVATIVTLSMVSLALRFLPVGLPFQNVFLFDLLPDLPACKGDNCSWQGWLSALSGYFALVAALIGVGITWSGLKHQARQTDFALGNGLPEFRILSAGTEGLPTLYQIVNWNKKTIYIREIQIKIAEFWGADQTICPSQMVYRKLTDDTEDERIRDLDKGELETGVGIEGWLDRQQPPSGWIFALKFPEIKVDDKFLEDYYQIRVIYLMHTDKGRIERYSMTTQGRLRHVLERQKAKPGSKSPLKDRMKV